MQAHLITDTPDTPDTAGTVELSRCSLAEHALAALGARMPALSGAPELAYLEPMLERAGADAASIERSLRARLERGGFAPEDAALLRVGARLELTPLELLATALALAAEHDPMAGRALAFLQRPVGGSRPTLWLVQDALGPLAERFSTPADALLAGNALGSGLLTLHGAELPLVERMLAVPGHVLLALRGLCPSRPGFDLDTHGDEVPLPASLLADAERYARALSQGNDRCLVIRTGSAREGRAVAGAVAAALGRRALFIAGDDTTSLAPWLLASELVPVFERQLGPSERCVLPRVAHYAGPTLALCGPDGGVDTQRGSALTFRVEVPAPSERQSLWRRALDDTPLAERLAHAHRHGASRIAELGRLARQRAQLFERAVCFEDVVAASCEDDSSGLGALAQPLPARIPSDALIVPPALKRELDLLLMRCRAREGLSCGLGVSTVARYRPGVRALLSGPSGTGKTLAAGWLASELGLPMYRVDVASVVSKYIGETEKNLAQLLAKAEHTEVLLLFDEADSLFGKRTDVKQANDRFANTQTNYLLQRIESYDGIVVLTTNSRTRLDSAFTRRLDFVVEFGAPKPDERRALWLAHLGSHHVLEARDINRLAALVELAGGHVRNIVLCAAVIARDAGCPVRYEDVLRGVSVEYRKLGKQVPSGLTRPEPALAPAPARGGGE